MLFFPDRPLPLSRSWRKQVQRSGRKGPSNARFMLIQTAVGWAHLGM
jgi:hypothetical protein